MTWKKVTYLEGEQREKAGIGKDSVLMQTPIVGWTRAKAHKLVRPMRQSLRKKRKRKVGQREREQKVNVMLLQIKKVVKRERKWMMGVRRSVMKKVRVVKMKVKDNVKQKVRSTRGMTRKEVRKARKLREERMICQPIKL